MVVGGPAGNYSPLFHTTDGGSTWSNVAVPNTLSRHEQAQLGVPVAAGSSVELPITVTDTVSSSQRVTLYSADAGATFSTAEARPLVIPPLRDAGYDPVSINGSPVWVAARGVIYESTDAGRHWTSVKTATQPVELTLIDASHAVGVAEDAGCRHFKSDCYDYRYLVATADSGHNWRPI